MFLFKHSGDGSCCVDPNTTGTVLVVLIDGDGGAPRASRPTSIPNMIGILKRKTNKEYGFKMWQTSYHDHIIRNDEEYLRIWKYIDENPIKWNEDLYPNDVGRDAPGAPNIITT